LAGGCRKLLGGILINSLVPWHFFLGRSPQKKTTGVKFVDDLWEFFWGDVFVWFFVVLFW